MRAASCALLVSGGFLLLKLHLVSSFPGIPSRGDAPAPSAQLSTNSESCVTPHPVLGTSASFTPSTLASQRVRRLSELALWLRSPIVPHSHFRRFPSCRFHSSSQGGIFPASAHSLWCSLRHPPALGGAAILEPPAPPASAGQFIDLCSQVCITLHSHFHPHQLPASNPPAATTLVLLTKLLVTVCSGFCCGFLWAPSSSIALRHRLASHFLLFTAPSIF